MVLAVFIILLLALACACITAYFRKRERRFADRIQQMLDDAIAGSFQERHLNESRVSAIENQLWRYLSDREAADRKLLIEKEQMQAHISDISHQAVIPISNIMLYAQLLKERLDCGKMPREEKTEIYSGMPGEEQGICPETQEIREELEAIREQAETLDFLIEALVKLSRLETGIIHINSRRQPLQPVLDAARSQFQGKASLKEIALEISGTEEYAVFDLKWTIEAVANIVDNAVKYTPAGGRITIWAEEYPSFIRLNVRDTGPGIAESEQANVFRRFYRSETVSEKPGVGIGLYLAREVMKAQGGYIRLASAIGQGSTFSLFFLKLHAP